MSREKVVEIDFLSRRYGVLPSEFLNLDVSELEFNIFVAAIGTQDESKQIDKLQRKAKGRGK